MMMIPALKQLNIHRQNPHIKATSYYHMNWETWIFCFFQVGWSKGIQTRSKIWRCSRYLLVLTEKSCWKQLIKVRTIFPRKVRACSLVLVEKELELLVKNTHTGNDLTVQIFYNTSKYIVHNTLQIRRKHSFSQEYYFLLNTSFLQSLLFSFFPTQRRLCSILL